MSVLPTTLVWNNLGHICKGVVMREDDINMQLTDNEIFMMAAESAIKTVFEEADDDTMYHHNVNELRHVTSCEKIEADSKDVAESILGWTTEL